MIHTTEATSSARRRILLLLGYHSSSIYEGIFHYAQQAKWVVDDNYLRVGIAPAGFPCDGILSLITNPKDIEALHLFPKVPIVDLSKGWITESSMPRPEHREEGKSVPRVCYDNVAIGRMAAKHLLEHGFKNIAYMNYGNFWMETERITPFRKEIESAGGKYFEIPFHTKFSHYSLSSIEEAEQAQTWLTKTLAGLPKPIGIAVSVDNLAWRILYACNALGLRIPDDVAVLGCENDPIICDHTEVPLSSIDINWERIGYEGAKLLDQILDGTPPPKEPVIIPPKGIVTRMSTDILAVPDSNIAKAIRFIWDNFTSNISTKDVAIASGLNRRKLERDFHAYTGRTINQEITRVRIEHAKNLLGNSFVKLYEVAELCGFRSASYFSKCFQRMTNMTPINYREYILTGKCRQQD